MEHQLEVAKAMLQEGHGAKRWWCQAASAHGLPLDVARGRGQDKDGAPPAPPPSPTPTPGPATAVAAADTGAAVATADGGEQEWRLTGHRQGRGRVYVPYLSR